MVPSLNSLGLKKERRGLLAELMLSRYLIPPIRGQQEKITDRVGEKPLTQEPQSLNCRISLTTPNKPPEKNSGSCSALTPIRFQRAKSELSLAVQRLPPT